MDAVFKALADPTRRQILRLLADGEKSAGDLAARFSISAPSMSHHFGVLKQANLVSTRRNGQQIHYSLNTTVFQELVSVLMDLFQREEDGTAFLPAKDDSILPADLEDRRKEG